MMSEINRREESMPKILGALMLLGSLGIMLAIIISVAGLKIVSIAIALTALLVSGLYLLFG